MMKLDLKDANFFIPIADEHSRYLRPPIRISVPIPFDMSTAPRTFTKVLKPVIALLRQRVIIYFDDLLLLYPV